MNSVGLEEVLAWLREAAARIEEQKEYLTQLDSAIGDADLVKYIDVGAYYYFNKNMSTYVDYKINQLDSDNKLGLKDDNVIAVALTYQF